LAYNWNMLRLWSTSLACKRRLLWHTN